MSNSRACVRLLLALKAIQMKSIIDIIPLLKYYIHKSYL